MVNYTLAVVLAFSGGLLSYGALADSGGHHGKGNNFHQKKNHDKPHKKPKGHHSPYRAPSNVIVVQQPVVSSLTINLNFGSVRPIAVDNGITGYGQLPYGIAKQVIIGRPLPPGIAKRRLPRHFESRLPAYEGYEWRMSGRDLMLLAVGSAVVIKVIENVFE